MIGDLLEVFRHMPISGSAPTEAVQESVDYRDAQTELLQERIIELEDALLGWRQISFENTNEFSRQGLREICHIARLMYRKNPLINRATEVQKFYVWAQGWQIKAQDPLVNDVVQEFMDDVKNQAALTSHQMLGMREVELHLTGNLFFVFFPDTSTGLVRVRLIDPDEVEEVVKNPQDSCEPWYYKRVWTETTTDLNSGGLRTIQRIAYYPDWRLPRGAPRPLVIGQGVVQMGSPVYHVKTGCLATDTFGLSEDYSAFDWALAYKDFLTDWAAVMRALAQFAFQFKTDRGPRVVSAVKERLNTTLSSGPGASPERNPPVQPGATWINTQGNDLQPLRTAGAKEAPDEARALRLMVAAGTGLTDTFFGDADVGNHATAKTLDRPTELRFKERQTLWADILTGILNYAIDWNVKAPSGLLAQYGRVVRSARTGEDVIEMAIDPETGEPYSRHIDVDFPDILERDVQARVGALVSAATLDGKQQAGLMTPRMLAQQLFAALGVDDIDEEMEALFPDGDEGSLPNGETPPDGETPPLPPDVAEAARELRRALTALTEVAA